MVTTYVGYQTIARDIDKALGRVDKQPVFQRESSYFAETIGKITSVEAFMADDKIYRFALKAYGLEDMSYAKAFIQKALEGGVTDPDSFANKLTDRRYAEFVAAFNFTDRGEKATSYAPAVQGVIDRFNVEAFKAGFLLDDPRIVAQNRAYGVAIQKITSINEFLKNDAALNYALKAHDLDSYVGGDKTFIRDLLEDGVADPQSLANRSEDKRLAAFVKSFNFAELGEKATTWRPAVEGTIAASRRQVLEEDAGSQNEGVRLALYFERKASSITSFLNVLADPALAQVMRTSLGLPDSFATSNIEKQVQFFESRMDVEDFQDPEKLDTFLKRFTAMWETTEAQSSTQSNLATLFGGAAEFGVSPNLLLTIQGLRK